MSREEFEKLLQESKESLEKRADEASRRANSVCWETLPDGTQPIRLSFQIKVF